MADKAAAAIIKMAAARNYTGRSDEPSWPRGSRRREGTPLIKGKATTHGNDGHW